VWQWIAGGGLVSVATCLILGLWGRGWRSEAKHLRDQLTQARLDTQRSEAAREALAVELRTSEAARNVQKAIKDEEAARYEEELEELRTVLKDLSSRCKCGSAADLLNRLSSPPGSDSSGQGTGGALPS
jgi:DNA anti-recombination protein RmuC